VQRRKGKKAKEKKANPMLAGTDQLHDTFPDFSHPLE
jgi:hypothetical protein